MDKTPIQKISYLVLRLFSSMIFIIAGFKHLLYTTGAATRLQNAAFGHWATWLAPAETLIILSGIGLLVGGIMLFTGLKTKWAAFVLLLILIPITLSVQLSNPEGVGPLFKNIALMGVLLFFVTNGATHYGLDQALALRKRMQLNLGQSGKKVYLAVVGTGMVLLLGSCAASGTASQSIQQQVPATTQKNYAVLTSEPNHLKAAVNTAETITGNSKYNSGAFVIMACGKSVEALVKGSDMAEVIEAGQKAGVTFRACGMSLKKAKIDPSQLADGIEVVPNGLTHMFDLQLEGYVTVEL